ncbi:hypothetical protein B0H17DRAFT_1327468 [Mycena rosella]|uniref:Uncharacterized protein n=1 Tax=Mycena rosella TaxID=1033263 RepID=A0AAD7DYI6_MYCRO|nr:hypothetical protein B0H17DRAFT_1327468 [Mycena rosella]
MPSVASVTRPSRRLAASRPKTTAAAIGSKLECAAHAQLVAQKRRIPLATKYDVNTGNVAPAPTKLSLPRTLPRPVLGEVKMSPILDAYPNLAGVPAEYIRDCLPSSTSSMRAALQALSTSELTGGLPKELQIIMNDVVSAACPTHMFAIYGDAPLAFGQKRHVSLFPFHHLVMGVHCAILPTLPASQPIATASHNTIPVVPLRVPSPETFALLHSYMYTQQPAILLAALAPPCESDILQLASHATKVHGLWRNACALGVVDSSLYDVLDASWAATIAAMQACS